MTQVADNDRIDVVKRKTTTMKGALVAIHREDDAPGIIFGVHDDKSNDTDFIILRLQTGKPCRAKRNEFTVKQSSNPAEILTILEINQDLDPVVRSRMTKAVERRITHLERVRSKK